MSFKTITITIHADGPRGEIGPQFFGHFTEETLTSWEGGSSSRQKVFDPGNPRFPCSYDAGYLRTMAARGKSPGSRPSDLLQCTDVATHHERIAEPGEY
jgi:hypothetical protein